ncbi:hypothetical protein B0H19DRAFT_1067607 [Mycena capillaripes]|nr:hypothetical protein B0H19DRAFT_1067607 [Mycena capillaripes]
MTEIPLFLAQVRAQWREVALSTPQLWSSICLKIPRSLPHYPDCTIPPVGAWFTRAHGYPLSIALNCGNNFRLPEELVALLKAKSVQWKRLELRLSPVHFLELNDVAGPFPSPKSLTTDPNGIASDNFAWNIDPYLQSPELSALSLGYPLTGIFPSAEHRSTCLTTLEFWTHHSRSAVMVFDLFLHLLHRVVHIAFALFDISPSTPPKLATAHLRCLVLDDNVDLLQYVTIPTLEHLGETIWSDAGAVTIVSFEERSGSVNPTKFAD